MKIDYKSIYHPRNLDHEYYKRQLKKPYESTVSFFKFLNSKCNLKNKKIADLACGNGANLIYLKKNFKVGDCYGLDQNSLLINQAKRITKKKKIKGLFFKKAKIQSNKMKSLKLKLDGVTCIQTLSVLDDYKKTVKFAKRLGSKFICVNSLFWKGEIDFKISVNFLKKNSRDVIKVNHYNIYSLSHYIKYLNKIGFKKHFILKFTNSKNLKTKKQNLMGSHTVNLNGKSVTKSGPLILEWFFILSKIN